MHKVYLGFGMQFVNVCFLIPGFDKMAHAHSNINESISRTQEKAEGCHLCNIVQYLNWSI